MIESVIEEIYFTLCITSGNLWRGFNAEEFRHQTESVKGLLGIMLKIYLTRHGETQWNLEKRLQ